MKDGDFEGALEAYIPGLIDGSFDGKTDAEIAQTLGVSASTIARRKKIVDWNYVKEERRKKFSQHTVEIDKALVRRAKAGDIKAIEMYYERFDGFVRRSAQINVNEPDAKLAERAKAIREEILAAIKTGGNRQDSFGDSPTATA